MHVTMYLGNHNNHNDIMERAKNAMFFCTVDLTVYVMFSSQQSQGILK